MRRLEVTFAGYWYTALTIALGVVALLSANNVLYLIESLLLSGMVFSGILSEKSVSAIEVEVRRGYAFAGSPCGDLIRLKNRHRFSIFCVEVGEWRDDGFARAAYVPRLGPLAELTVDSKLQFETRGRHQWKGLAIATSYPFGLARKIRVIERPGDRLIWPEKAESGKNALAQGDRGASIRSGQEFSEGEVRPYTYEDDCRNIVWALSEKGLGPLVRMRKSRNSEPRVTLDLRCEPGPEFEKAVIRAAAVFQHQESFEGTLTIIERSGARVYRGRIASLNQLAVAQASPGRDEKRSRAA